MWHARIRGTKGTAIPLQICTPTVSLSGPLEKQGAYRDTPLIAHTEYV